ncbi:MAG: hypothetical protein QXZ31_05630 [Thermofilaceae archaeon]
MGAVELERLAREYMVLARRVVEEVKSDPGSHSYSEVRMAVQILDLGEDGVKTALEKLAKSYSGCVSCRHSTPVPHHLSLLSRFCRLGLTQDTCGSWEPIL